MDKPLKGKDLEPTDILDEFYNPAPYFNPEREERYLRWVLGDLWRDDPDTTTH